MSEHAESLRGKRLAVPVGYGRCVIGAISLLLVIISFLPVGSGEDGAVRFRWDLPDHITPLSIGELRATPTDWAIGMFVYASALAGICGLAAVVAKPSQRGDWAGCGGAIGLVTLVLPLISAVFATLALAVGSLAVIVIVGAAAMTGGAIMLVRYRPKSKAMRLGAAAMALLCVAAEVVLWLVMTQRPPDAPSLWPAGGGWMVLAIAVPLNVAVVAAILPIVVGRFAMRLYKVASISLIVAAGGLLIAQWLCAPSVLWICHVGVVGIGCAVLLAVGLPATVLLKRPGVATPLLHKAQG